MLSFGKITIETKTERFLIQGDKPEADRVVKMLKAVKSANNPKALPCFTACKSCAARVQTKQQVRTRAPLSATQRSVERN